MVKYADDVAIAVPYASSQTANLNVLEEFEHMESWCRCKGLQLNKSKTKAMMINKKCHRDTILSNLEITNAIKILGITLQNDLKWNLHVSNICKVAARRVYILKEMKRLQSLTKRDLMQVYNSHIRSILEYNSPLFVGTSKQNSAKIERIRKRCHRIICDFDCKCNVLPP